MMLQNPYLAWALRRAGKICMMKKCAIVIVLILLVSKGRAQSVENDTLKFSNYKKEISTFLKIIDTAGLNQVFSGRPVTILAPDNKALENSPIPDSLFKPANKALLVSLLNNHIISGAFTAKDISALIHKGKGLIEFTALSGKKYTAGIDANRNIAFVDGSGAKHIIKVFDLHYGNAVIFIIDSVISTKE
jgi:uncharacterized surface protein with fasciclin (FAS1) repeats